MPMLFYVPPMSPVMSQQKGDTVDHLENGFFHDIESSRVPMKFLANLFGAGHEAKVTYALKKQKAVRWYRRAVTVGDISDGDGDADAARGGLHPRRGGGSLPSYLHSAPSTIDS